MKQFIAQALIVHRSTDPTVNDNLGRGFDVESEWYNGVKFWKLISFSGSYANWSLVGSGGGSTSDDITNESGVTGATVTDALDELLANDTTTLNDVKSYADSLVVGLWDDRGAYTVNSSGNINYPSTGGSGTAGALLKGDIFTVANATVNVSTINSIKVNNGDTVRALIDSPSPTNDSHWTIAESNLGFTPENTANKDVSGGYVGLTLFKINFKNVLNTFTSFFTNSNTAARTYTFQDRDGIIADDTDLATKQATLTAANFATFVNSTTDKTTPVDADIVPTIDVSTGKRFSLSNLWTDYLKPKADAIYATISNLNLKMNLSMSARTIKLNKTASTANGIDGSVTDLMGLMAGCTDNTGSGALLAISTTNTKAIRFTSGASILRSFAGGTDGAILVCQNSNSALMSVNHEDTDETTVANRIYTGGQNVQVGIGGVFVLQYKTSNSRWNLIGGNGLNYWSVFAGSSNRLVEVDTNGVGSASKSFQDIDFTPAQKTSATTGSWTGVNEITISGLKQGQYYADVAGGFNYGCHVNDKCNRTPNVNLTPITTNLIYPLNEITGTSGTLIGDNSYILNNASQVVMSLPATGVQGDVIPISGKGAGGWRVTVPNTQQIVGGLTNTLTNGSGYIQAGQYAAVTLKCITGGTAAIWEIVCINPATTLTIV